jgi:Tol biopolymer transport system component
MEIFRFDDWKLAVNGGGEANLAKKPLTNNNVYDAEASYSPDGKWITYTHGAGAAADIYVMRADGSGAVQITKEKGYDGGPFFSPDGKRLVYRSDRKGNDLLQVFVAQLAFDEKGNITGRKSEHQLTNDEFVNWGPYWHPGGRHIIYATSAQGHTNYELYLMNAEDGSNKRRITFTEGADVLPVFSPDGKWLMWTSKRSKDNTSQVFAARFHMPE